MTRYRAIVDFCRPLPNGNSIDKVGLVAGVAERTRASGEMVLTPCVGNASE